MFKLSRDELNRRHMAKPIQTTEEMFEALGFNDLVEPGVKVELSTAFHDVFERYARTKNPEDGGEKVFVYDAHPLVESVSRMWAELYSTAATSREEVLRNKALLEEDLLKLSEAEEKNVKKLAGELEVCKGKLQTVQQSYMERGTEIDKLEALVAALSVKPSNVINPHRSRSSWPNYPYIPLELAERWLKLRRLMRPEGLVQILYCSQSGATRATGPSHRSALIG